ncbi:MAG: MBOAT family protein [Clostridiaceae bacterium]|nr:MBOAT family protein [Clostridiaceae bacterium]
MVFSSVSFLFLFLPITLFLVVITRGRIRNYILLIMSLIFYAWGEPIYVFLMIFSAFVNYCLAYLLIGKHKKIGLVIMIVFNLLLLGYFKYTGFVIKIINDLTGLKIIAPKVLLPIGISFYTFQTMSYMFDVYRQETELQKNFADLLLYITFFPQLIAGPIVRYHDIALQIHERIVTKNHVVSGFQRFIIGLGKKVLIANQMAIVVDYLYQHNAWSFATSWLAAITYLLQIYFDFSGYSDMAIGLGRIFGFEFKENFEYPLTSNSIQDFWRRWHISLSTWFKEYLYIPLGGSRRSRGRVIFNYFFVFFCTGLWHGASWNFVIWGLWQWFFIMLERYLLNIKKWPKILQHIYTLVIVIVGFVFFRAETLTEAVKLIGIMFNPLAITMPEASIAISILLNPWFVLILCAGIIGSTQTPSRIAKKASPYIQAPALLAIWVMCLLTLSASGYNPFIYFRF